MFHSSKHMEVYTGRNTSSAIIDKQILNELKLTYVLTYINIFILVTNILTVVTYILHIISKTSVTENSMELIRKVKKQYSKIFFSINRDVMGIWSKLV